jgi:predicted O-methyltransferase YrrM
VKLSDLHAVNPYDGFNRAFYPEKIEGWNSDGLIFLELLMEHRPHLVVEVGTWLGASALHMASLLDRLPDCRATKIVCVDTWLGALEFWTDQNDPTRYRALELTHGYPTVYRRFLANVLHRGQQDRIIPFPQTSLIAARWFARREEKLPFVYLDASHDYDDVLADLRAWWPLIAPGGVLFGDDYGTWEGVRLAVECFHGERAGHVSKRIVGNHWVLTKP